MSETKNATLPKYLTHAEREMVERFPADIANHAMTVLHDDGLYRHLRFAQPGSSFYWFEIVTWPGSLTVHGDVGSFTFSRITDMFEFFRRNGNSYGINPGYWSEKLPTNGRDAAKQHSEQVLKDTLASYLAEYEQWYPQMPSEYKMTPDEVRELIAGYETDDQLRFPEGARELLRELEEVDVLSDTWEWSLTDWTWEFLWCCHAIVWGIRQYGQVKASGGR